MWLHWIDFFLPCLQPLWATRKRRKERETDGKKGSERERERERWIAMLLLLMQVSHFLSHLKRERETFCQNRGSLLAQLTKSLTMSGMRYSGLIPACSPGPHVIHAVSLSTHFPVLPLRFSPVHEGSCKKNIYTVYLTKIQSKYLISLPCLLFFMPFLYSSHSGRLFTYIVGS